MNRRTKSSINPQQLHKKQQQQQLQQQQQQQQQPQESQEPSEEKSQEQQPQEQETSQAPVTPPPPPQQPPAPPPSGSSPLPQPPISQAELQKQENLRQFNILLTPAFAAFSQIVDGLFLTGVGGMSVDNLRRNRITHIINCTHEAPNWRLSGVECNRIPIDDNPTEDLLAYLDIGVEKIHLILTNGGRAVVHCVAGVSRSAAIVMGYLIKHKKMSLHDAYNHVQSCRRVVRPNNGFFSQLIVYENQIHGTNSVKMIKLKRDDVTIEIPDFFETEHRKFVLLETFKAKASSLKAIVQSGAGQMVHGTQTGTNTTTPTTATTTTTRGNGNGKLRPRSNSKSRPPIQKTRNTSKITTSPIRSSTTSPTNTLSASMSTAPPPQSPSQLPLKLPPSTSSSKSPSQHTLKAQSQPSSPQPPTQQ